MKKLTCFLILYFLLVITNYSFSQSGWYWQNPKPQGNDLKSISFLNSTTGFAVGNIGSVIKTTNKGESWFPVYFPFTQNFLKIKFIDSNTGFLLGNDYVLIRTTNGGNNWGILNIPNDSIIDFSFFNNTRGIVVGKHKLYNTTNSGINWTLVYSLYNYEYFTNSIYLNDSTIYLGGGAFWGYMPVGYFFRTTNYCLDWSKITTNNYSNIALFFFNPSIGFLAGDPSNRIIKTFDGGNSWQTFSVTNYYNINNNNIVDIKFLNNQTGFLSTADTIFKTTNGGNNWIRFGDYSVFSFENLDNNTIIGVGSKGNIFKSSDGGINFINKKTTVTDARLNTIHCVTDSIYYAAGVKGGTGNAGVIIKTTNGGSTWFIQNNDFNSNITKIRFLDINNGAVAASWLILHTTNGGINWIIQKYDSAKYYRDIWFININTGYVVGESGISLKTTNGGINWQKLNLDSTLSFVSLYFINSMTGFIYGQNWSGNPKPNIFKTTNGGISWNGYFGQTNGMAIYFVNNLTGFTAGYNRKVFRTSNGGINWDSCSTDSHSWLESISFINQTTGFIVGTYDRELLKTTNSGINWVSIKPLDNDLFGISSYNGVAVFVGENGLIKSTKYTSGIGINQINEVVPNNFNLLQNYPNPFNPSTTIKYEVSKIQNIKLVVYDILGKEIATLVNEIQKPGVYEIQFPDNLITINRLPSGVYFYKLTSGDFTETKKMALIK